MQSHHFMAATFCAKFYPQREWEREWAINNESESDRMRVKAESEIEWESIAKCKRTNDNTPRLTSESTMNEWVGFVISPEANVI